MVQTLPKTSSIVPSAPFTTRTDLILDCGDMRFGVSEIGPGFLSLQEPSELPPGPATVVASVDDRVQHWSVVIPDGLDPAETEVPLPTLGPENRHDGPPPGWPQ